MFSMKMMRKKFQGFSIVCCIETKRGVAVATVTDPSAFVHCFVFNNRKRGAMGVCVCVCAFPLSIRFETFIVMANACIDPL